ncbi:MAG: histidine phosphatase family protein [Erysipelotrichaceae bacterium]|nr:histidine phosphatase family protein [Erysipelotrichaceae bacterium]
MKTLYVLRHGQTDWNRWNLLQGITNTALNDSGTRQARLAKTYIDTLPVKEIYSSPLSRAVLTGLIATQGRDLPVHIEKGLHERDFGRFEATGPNHRPLPEHIKTFADLEKEEGFDGETTEEAGKRFEKTLIEIAEKAESDDLLLVSHGGVICAYLEYYYQSHHIPYTQADVTIPNCSVSTFTYDGELHIKQIGYNDYLNQKDC